MTEEERKIIKQITDHLICYKCADATSSVKNPVPRSTVFCKKPISIIEAEKLKEYQVCVIIDEKTPEIVSKYVPKEKLIKVPDAELFFYLFHNRLYEKMSPTKSKINPYSLIHSSVVLDVDGLKIIKGLDGRLISVKHMGNVVIEKDVEIGPYTVIHRSLFESTIISEGSKIGAKCNIAHNCKVGKNSILTMNILMGGSSHIGDNCWVGMSTTIRNGISICNDVMIGQESNVVSNIYEPGLYYGNPVKRIKDWNGKWY